MEKNREKKKQIAANTLAIVEAGNYTNGQGQTVPLQFSIINAKSKSKLFKEREESALWIKRDLLLGTTPRYQTSFTVENRTTLEACSELVANGEVVFCLNFASAKNAGGGFLGGAEAQEESLARSSALYPCLVQFQQDFYDYHRHGDTYYSHRMIYSPNVPVFKDDNGRLLDQPYEVSFLTSPAVNVGALKQKYQYNTAKTDELMLKRTEKLLSIAYVQGYKTLVLGAWGCGVFRQDPEKVAQYFAHFLCAGGLFENCFEKVVFAVLSRDEKNILPFQELFMAD